MRFGNVITVLALAGAAVGAGAEAAGAQTIKIGFVNSSTGFLAQQGDQMDKGIRLYVKTHENDLPPGVKAEP